MKYNIQKWKLSLLLCMMVMTSCNKWLEVTPIDQMAEDKLFATEEGFREALNGVYLGMMDDRLYGRNLSCTFIEVLGQRYNIESEDHKFAKLAKYTYTEDGVKNLGEEIWQEAYFLISNCNYILLQADRRKGVFTENNYNLIKGEAYALRAYLHFDLFRLWGPSYGEDTKNEISIPYYLRQTSEPEALLTAEAVVDRVLADLDSAEICLAKDPIKEGSPAYSTYRNLTMNWYAVRALKARVLAYTGYPDKAYMVATRLISQITAQNAFPFIGENYIADVKNPDRLFYSEQIFCLENQNRGKLYTDFFDPQLTETDFLGPASATISNMFINSEDTRKIYWNFQPSGSKAAALAKFEKVSEGNAKMSPRATSQSLIRLGELYLIAAETGLEIGMETESINFMNKFLMERRYKSNYVATPSQLQDILSGEYSREFIAEGQYFFYLKRKRMATIPAGKGGATIDMSAKTYVLPLPDSETQYRNN